MRAVYTGSFGPVQRCRWTPTGWRTLRLSGREWKYEPRLLEAIQRGFPDARRRGRPTRDVVIRRIESSPSRNADPEPEEWETTWRLRVERPDRTRAEFNVGEEWVTAVFCGDTWWGWAPSRGARTNAGRHNVGHGKGPGWALVDTSAIPALLALTMVDTARFLDRETMRQPIPPFSRGSRPAPDRALGQGAA